MKIQALANEKYIEWRSYMKRLNRKVVIAIASIVIGLMMTFFTSAKQMDMNELQENIADKIIRFHVIANSDSDEDQELKLEVKEAIVEYISPYFEESESIEESREILLGLSDEIKKIANEVIASEGYTYTVTVELKDCYFPTKAYGDIVLPPGYYESYQIEIGEAQGKNWWCILYPPLCFVDVTHGVVPAESKEMLANILDEDEYESISNAKQTKTSYRFKILEIFGYYD